MPPAKKPTTNKLTAGAGLTSRLTAGAGLTAGLELHARSDGKFILHDTTTDSRFAEDVALWSAGLNPPTRKKTKNATPAQ